ncbi:pheA operon leader peptide PheL [Pantoea agglomerans]|nr:pheA operon leader peptide PheL [Pantoea agglomerans]
MTAFKQYGYSQVTLFSDITMKLDLFFFAFFFTFP